MKDPNRSERDVDCAKREIAEANGRGRRVFACDAGDWSDEDDATVVTGGGLPCWLGPLLGMSFGWLYE